MDFLHRFLDQWVGALPTVALTFLGVLLFVLVVALYWDRRVRATGALVGMLAGLAIVFYSPILRGLSTLSPEHQVALAGGGLGCGIIIATSHALWRMALPKRYAIIYFGLGLAAFVTAFHSGIVQTLARAVSSPAFVVLGCGCVLLLFFLLLNFSIAIGRLEQRLAALSKKIEKGAGDFPEGRERLGERGESFSSSSLLRRLFSTQEIRRTIRGTRIGAPLSIAVATLAVLGVGLAAPQAMIGDEVTHYYMLAKQAQDLSTPNFFADIPMASGGVETRRYPHSFGWHYLGALVYFISGGSFAGVQVYQAFFLLQMLLVAYLLAKSRGGVESRAALLYVLVLASLPLCLIFSVAFYQDVPMTAQILTAFYLLRRGRWFWASCFMALAMAMKVTALLFFPAFFILAGIWQSRDSGLKRGGLVFVCAACIVLGSTWLLGKAINTYAHTAFYPQEKLEKLASAIANRISEVMPAKAAKSLSPAVEEKKVETQYDVKETISETAPVIIANHPGDLRIKENFLVYGGLLLWFLLAVAIVAGLRPGNSKGAENRSPTLWLYCVGGSFLALTAYFTRTAPDARFFLPGLPFILLPAAEFAVRLPKPKILITLFASLALLQGGYVLDKAYNLRRIPTGIVDGIEYLKANPPRPGRVFMYPEGNYRLFPVHHEWYLGFRLREFWRGDNDLRLRLLQEFQVGAVVIKKHLVASVDDEITNLGVYPTGFVADIEGDGRFAKLFDNETMAIYRVPTLE